MVCGCGWCGVFVCDEVGFDEVGVDVGVVLVVVWFSGVENFLIGWVVFCFSLCGCWVGVLWVGGWVLRCWCGCDGVVCFCVCCWGFCGVGLWFSFFYFVFV